MERIYRAFVSNERSEFVKSFVNHLRGFIQWTHKNNHKEQSNFTEKGSNLLVVVLYIFRHIIKIG